MIERRRILVAVRVSDREHSRWQTAADREDLKLVELVREAVRTHLRDLERLRLFGCAPERADRPAAAAVSE